ncbi:MAG: 2-succinylbenzoate--CoA ligase [Cyanobacteria bacterium P01_G01_bin.19]
MKSDLWTRLIEYGDRAFIWQYTKDLNKERSSVIPSQNITSTLIKEVEAVVADISSLNDSSSAKLNIFIAESNPVKFLTAFLGAIISEVRIFLCDPNWQQQEWRQVLSLVEPDSIFAESGIKDLISHIKLPTSKPEQLETNSCSESLIMIPTGGSSGKIKFAIHTWATLEASVIGFQKYFDCQKINSCCTLPLYHVSGLMQFMRSFSTQGNLILCNYQLIKKFPSIHNSSDFFISLVPTQLQFIIDTNPTWLKKFKTILLGGASIPRSLLVQAREHNLPLAPIYGMTETASGIVALKPEDFLEGNNSNGLVLPHAKIVIDAPTNKPGAIALECQSLCYGYYPKFFQQSNFIATDDVGYLDSEGYLHLVGRNSQKIITGGENVFPAEVEEVILATKLVKDVCVLGISDRRWGQAVTALYIPIQSDLNLDWIKQKIGLQLSKYKQPKHWLKVDTLPRNDRGKIDYDKARAIACKLIK